MLLINILLVHPFGCNNAVVGGALNLLQKNSNWLIKIQLAH